MLKKTNIIVTLNFTALHQWQGCDFKEVAYLKHLHRHVFKITAKAEVSHDDRDIEIIMFKNSIRKYLHETYYVDKYGMGYLKNRSCEQLAAELVEKFKLNYCSVLEDGENGAEVIINN